MRSRIALAALLAGAAAFVAPAAPASAYCEHEIVILGDGGGSGECSNSCYETGETYEKVRLALVEKFEAAEVVPGYWDLFVCMA